MELGDFQVTTSVNREVVDTEPSRKGRSIDMLKEKNSLNRMIDTMSYKSQEYIDHDSLGPEGGRDPNNIIIDLIDQHVFEKSATNTAGDVAFIGKDQSLNSELQFQNAILQFVNKHGQIQYSTDEGVSMIANSVGEPSMAFGNRGSGNFISLNGSFLGDCAINNKEFCTTSDSPVQHQYSSSLGNSSLDTISDIDHPDRNASLISEGQLICSRSNVKKILPHKKRISKKLKVTQNTFEYTLSSSEIESKEGKHDMIKQNLMQFTCEICGHSTSSQMEFFAHLKQHYEPVLNANAETMKASLREEPGGKSSDNNTFIEGKKIDHVIVEQVFPNVHINFEDFHAVDDSIEQTINQSNQEDDMKILTSSNIDKCIHFVTHCGVESSKNVNADEVEFSDTEDMLEGIRNVVDKVSIEDSCDALDMVTSDNLRTSWFASNSFNSISFKTKTLDESSLKATISNELKDSKLHNENTASEVVQVLEMTKPGSLLDLSDVELKVSCEDITTYCDELNSANMRVSSTGKAEMQRPSKGASTKYNRLLKSTKPQTDIVIGESHDTLASKVKNGRFSCTKCDREFNSNNALKYHQRTHTGIRPYECDVCFRSFFALGALKSHIRTHTGDKPFECEHCLRKFRQMGDLKYHITSIHNVEKYYQCEFCGKAFSRKYSMVLHRRIHTSERNYKCEFCPKSFRASIYLQNHRKIHTGEKPYQCVACSKKFRVSGDLRRHARTHERKDSKERGGDHVLCL